jgi:hypothetical protein
VFFSFIFIFYCMNKYMKMYVYSHFLQFCNKNVDIKFSAHDAFMEVISIDGRCPNKTNKLLDDTDIVVSSTPCHGREIGHSNGDMQ